MAAVEIYNGPVASAVTGAWVAIPASTTYTIHAVGYGANGPNVEFSLDGVNAFTPNSGAVGSPLKGVGGTTQINMAWTLTGVPCAYARFSIGSGTAGATNKTMLQAL